MSDVSLPILLTDAGLAAVAAAHGQGVQAKITHVAIGDQGYVAAASATALRHECTRVALTAGGALGPRQVLLQGHFPSGGAEFFIRELGYYLEDGTLLGVWSEPERTLGWVGGATPWFFKLIFAWDALPDGAVTVVFDGTASDAATALDLAQIEAKVRHTVTTSGQTWDSIDDTQLTKAIPRLISSGIETAPQFDNDLSVATTEFVQRALGNAANCVSINVPTALTAAEAGHVVLIGTGAKSVTLPRLADVPSGTTYRIWVGGETPTVSVGAAGDLIVLNGGVSAASMPLGSGDTLTVTAFVATGVRQWHAIGGSAQLRYASALEASIGPSGRSRHPSGLIEQWGVASAVGGGGIVITFPIAFPTACLAVGASSAVGPSNNATFNAYNWTKTGFTLSNQNPSGTYLAQTCSWRALGS